MKLNQKKWSCPKKLKAREETVISFYRNNYGQSVPKDKQYWTISGQCAEADGTIIKNCELDHLVKEELIVPEQFHSAEIVPEIFAANAKIPKAHWHQGDFYDMMVQASNEDKFNPAIVNFDSLWMPENGTEYLAKILAFLTSLEIMSVMVVGNFILRTRHYASSNDEAIRFLSGLPQFRYAMSRNHWEIYDQGYTYNGTGGNRTVMGTIVIMRK